MPPTTPHANMHIPHMTTMTSLHLHILNALLHPYTATPQFVNTAHLPEWQAHIYYYFLHHLQLHCGTVDFQHIAARC